MTVLAQRVEGTVRALFQWLEQSGVRYAMLRNYESFPSFYDIDLVMDARDIPKWREVAPFLAKQHGWDALTECDHWARSSVSHHNSEVFRFYHIADNVCLEVDLFHGFSLWGLPLFSEQQLLSGSVRDDQYRFTKIDPVVENLWRILQIHRYAAGPFQDKVARYRDRLIDFCIDQEQLLRRMARERLSVFGDCALDDLLDGDMREFARHIRFGKAFFLRRYALRHPFSMVRDSLVRAADYSRLFLLAQCGFTLRVHACGDGSRERLRHALDSLVKSKVLFAWTSHGAHRSPVSLNGHKVMEQGGLVVRWVHQSSEVDIEVDSYDSSEELSARVMELLIGRHPSLYRKHTALFDSSPTDVRYDQR